VTLTGKTRYRANWRGKIILQVEYAYRCLPAGARPTANGGGIVTKYEWRDARVSDIFARSLAVAPQSAEDGARE
jgi:hypothetical protein